jgi:hypothetical protein
MGELALLGRLISRTFQPVKIHLPIAHLIGKKFKYENELFSMNLICNDNNIKFKVVDKENTKQYRFMTKYLKYYQKYDIDLPITQYQKDKNLLTIDSVGHIPIRWIYLFKDMVDFIFVIEHLSEMELIRNEHSILQNIYNIHNNNYSNNYNSVCNKLYNLYYDKNINLKFAILSAPSYNFQDTKDIYVRGQLSQCYQYNDEDIKKELKDRKWICYDKHYSVATSIFLKKSWNYYSLGYFCAIKMKWIIDGYGCSLDAVKYFPMHNCLYQPWYKFLQNYDFCKIKYLSCGEENIYSNNETINFEEMVIFKEILKKEGAKIKII